MSAKQNNNHSSSINSNLTHSGSLRTQDILHTLLSEMPDELSQDQMQLIQQENVPQNYKSNVQNLNQSKQSRQFLEPSIMPTSLVFNSTNKGNTKTTTESQHLSSTKFQPRFNPDSNCQADIIPANLSKQIQNYQPLITKASSQKSLSGMVNLKIGPKIKENTKQQRHSLVLSILTELNKCDDANNLNQSQTSNNNVVEEARSKLRDIYNFYVKLSGNNKGLLTNINNQKLKSQGFIKMMNDIGVLDQQNQTPNKYQEIKHFLDLVYKTTVTNQQQSSANNAYNSNNSNQNWMDFDQFLQALVKISQPVYSQNQDLQENLPKATVGQQFKYLLETKLLPLHQSLDFNTQDNFQLNENEPETAMVLRDVLVILLEIFQKNFKQLLVKDCSLQETQKMLLKFLRKFDLCPDLVSHQQVFVWFEKVIKQRTTKFAEVTLDSVLKVYWNQISIATIKDLQPKIGRQEFTFLQFVDFLCYVAIGGFTNQNNSQPGQQPLTQAEKVCLCLQRMQLSEGARQEQSQTRILNGKFTLIPTKTTLDAIKLAKDLEQPKSEPDVQKPNKNVLKPQKPLTGYIDPKTKEIESFKSLQHETLKQLDDKDIALLSRLFDFYSQQGDSGFVEALNCPSAKVYVKHQFFLKLLKAAKLLEDSSDITTNNQPTIHEGKLVNSPKHHFRKIGAVEADLIFQKFFVKQQKCAQAQQCQDNKKQPLPNGLSFGSFCLSLLEISKSCFQNLKTNETTPCFLMNTLVNYSLKSLDKKISQKYLNQLTATREISYLLKALNEDPNLVELLKLVHRTLLPFYQFYAEQGQVQVQEVGRTREQPLLQFDGFLKFCTDFELFPDILNKSKMRKIYFTLARFGSDKPNDSQENQTQQSQLQRQAHHHQTKKIWIDEHLFVQAIAISAFEMSNYSENRTQTQTFYSNFDQILTLMEKMNRSEGPAKVQHAYGVSCLTGMAREVTSDLLHLIRQEFPQWFAKRQVQFDNDVSLDMEKQDSLERKKAKISFFFDKLREGSKSPELNQNSIGQTAEISRQNASVIDVPAMSQNLDWQNYQVSKSSVNIDQLLRELA